MEYFRIGETHQYGILKTINIYVRRSTMKKLLVVVLACMMLFTMVSYGGDAEPETLTLKMACFSGEETFFSQKCVIWQNKVKELSGGTIDFDYYPGGTLCAINEEYDFLGSGVIDVAFFMPAPNTSIIPYSYGVEGAGDVDLAADCMRSIYLEDPTCSAIIEKYTSRDNVKIFGTEADGGDVVASAMGEVTSLEDLKTGVNGVTRNAPLYQALGHNTVNINNPDVYDSLQRGVCDFVFNTAPNIISGRTYEVAKHGFIINDCGTQMVYACNRNVWDSLTEEQQGWFIEAAEYLNQEGLKMIDNYITEFKSLMETCNEGDPEEAWDFAMLMNQMDAPGIIANAEALDGEEGKEDMIYLTLYKEAYLDHGPILGPEYDEYREKFGEITVTK